MYLGDYDHGDRAYFGFNTVDSNGASVTYTGGSVKAYINGALVGTLVGITVTKDSGGDIGQHDIEVDTGEAPYSIRDDVVIKLIGATIDGETVNAVIAHLSIENRIIKDNKGDVEGDVEGDIFGNLFGDINSDVLGNIVGSVLGNVAGNVNGSTASVTGNVGGDVVGDLQGDVLGNVAGSEEVEQSGIDK